MPKQHTSKDLKKLLKIAKDNGIKVELQGLKGIIYPPEGEYYLFHLGDRAYHPVRRFLQKKCGIMID